MTLLTDAQVEVCAPSNRASPAQGVSVIERPPGTRGAIDLRRRSERLAIGDHFVDIASPLDLLRVERARGRTIQAGALEAVLEHRRRWPDGPPPRRSYSDDEARAAVQAWQPLPAGRRAAARATAARLTRRLSVRSARASADARPQRRSRGHPRENARPPVGAATDSGGAPPAPPQMRIPPLRRARRRTGARHPDVAPPPAM